MTKKLIISEKQLRVITKHIDGDYELISEGIIEEGFKEIALSLLMLAGATLSGQNKAIAQNALSNPQIVRQVDSVLSDSTKLESVIGRIEDALPNAGELIKKNAEQIKATINYIESKDQDKVIQTTQTATAKNSRQLKNKLQQGFAISGVKITRDTVLPPESVVIIKDTIDYNWSSDNFFVTGSFDLNGDAMDSISTVVGDIKSAGGKVLGVNIESSTDTEPIRMGNDKLAQLRADSIEKFMMSLDLGGAQFNTTTKPDNGPTLYERGMSSGDRLEARIKTSSYRYVKIKLIVLFETEVEPDETAPQVIERHNVELVKVYVLSATNSKFKFKGETPKSSCHKLKIGDPSGKTKIFDCVFKD